ncbi:hypothetical protein B6175_08670 [Staphylococcus aureus]|nr:hypothetical protein B6175_08670 [Staphylococcus aureus]
MTQFLGALLLTGVLGYIPYKYLTMIGLVSFLLYSRSHSHHHSTSTLVGVFLFSKIIMNLLWLTYLHLFFVK